MHFLRRRPGLKVCADFARAALSVIESQLRHVQPSGLAFVGLAGLASSTQEVLHTWIVITTFLRKVTSAVVTWIVTSAGMGMTEATNTAVRAVVQGRIAHDVTLCAVNKPIIEASILRDKTKSHLIVLEYWVIAFRCLII